MSAMTIRLTYAPKGRALSPTMKRVAFLRAFWATGSASFAAACAGVQRTTPYVWKAQEPDFALLWEEGRYAERTHTIHRPHLKPARMNDRLLEFSMRRAAGQRRRISTLTATPAMAKTPSDRASDGL
jgi:hypothetical protein